MTSLPTPTWNHGWLRYAFSCQHAQYPKSCLKKITIETTPCKIYHCIYILKNFFFFFFFAQECLCLQEFHSNQTAWALENPSPTIDWILRVPAHYLLCSCLISVPQVNASPSLSHTTPSDRIMKTSLINDIINIVLSPKCANKILITTMKCPRSIANIVYVIHSNMTLKEYWLHLCVLWRTETISRSAKRLKHSRQIMCPYGSVCSSEYKWIES